MKQISDEFCEAAIDLSGAEFRLWDWHICCSDEDEGQEEGFKYIGIEQSEEYVAMAEARLKRETAQQRLLPTA